MKPKGLVLAASMTSQMSMSMRSHSMQQLVDERDVHAAEDVLEQLGHLGGARRRDRHDCVEEALVERDRDLRALRRDAADDLRRVLASGSTGLPGSTRSGENARKSLADPQPAALEDRLDDLLGGARDRSSTRA